MGVKHPDYLNLSSKQLNEWKAYNLIEPFGAQQLNFQIAMIPAMLKAIHRSSKTEKIKLEDYVIGYQAPPAKPMTPEELEKALMIAFGGSKNVMTKEEAKKIRKAKRQKEKEAKKIREERENRLREKRILNKKKRKKERIKKIKKD